jgi:hypothetical protein
MSVALAVSLMLVFVMGMAIQRGNTCTVSTVARIKSGEHISGLTLVGFFRGYAVTMTSLDHPIAALLGLVFVTVVTRPIVFR